MTGKISRRKAASINLGFHYLYAFLGILRGVALVPLYLQALGPSLYGAWLATGNVLAWLTLVDPGVGVILQQQIGGASGEGDRSRVQGIIWSALVIALITPVVMLAVGFLAGYPFLGLIPLDPEPAKQLRKAFIWMVLGNAVVFASFPISGALLGLQESFKAGLIHSLGLLLNIALTVILLINGFGLMAFPLSAIGQGVLLVVANVAVLVGWYVPSQNLVVTRDRAELRRLGRLFPYGFIGRVGSNLAQNLDALAVAVFLGPTAAVILNCTKKVTELMVMLLRRVAVSIMPAIAHLKGEGRHERLKEIVGILIPAIVIATAAGSSCVLALNDSFVALWVGKQYFGGFWLNTLVVLSVAVFILNDTMSGILFGCGKIRETSLISLADGVARLAVLICCLKVGLQLVSAPVALLFSGVGVSLTILSLLLKRELNLSFQQIKKLFSNNLYAIFAVVFLGILVGGGITIKTWTQFITVGFAYAAITIAFLLTISKVFRSALIVVFHQLRRNSDRKKNVLLD